VAIRQRYKPTALAWGCRDNYSEGKGQRLHVVPSTTRTLDGIVFVFLHLLTHLANPRMGHDVEFWRIRRFLVERAVLYARILTIDEVVAKFATKDELREIPRMTDAAIIFQAAWRAREPRLSMFDRWTEFCASGEQYYTSLLEKYGDAPGGLRID